MHPVLSRQQKADGILGFSTVMAAALIALVVKSCVGCGGGPLPRPVGVEATFRLPDGGLVTVAVDELEGGMPCAR